MAEVYAFHGLVALNPDGGETLYLPPAEAARLAKALGAMARDVGAGKWPDPMPDAGAGFSHTADGLNVGKAQAAGLIRARMVGPGVWHGQHRGHKGGRWRTVRNGAGELIAYASRGAALKQACYAWDRPAGNRKLERV